jgi:hypothetical protein
MPPPAAGGGFKQRKNRGNLRKRDAPAGGGDGGGGGGGDDEDETAVVRKAKAAKGDPLAFSTKRETKDEVVVTYASSRALPAGGDGGATRILETETEFDRDARRGRGFVFLLCFGGRSTAGRSSGGGCELDCCRPVQGGRRLAGAAVGANAAGGCTLPSRRSRAPQHARAPRPPPPSRGPAALRRALREKVLARAADAGAADGTYRGMAGYTDYKTTFRREKTARGLLKF